MDGLKTKTTVPYPSVGADGGQSLSQKPNQSIAEGVTEHKPPERDLAEIMRQISRVNDPAYLPTVSMNDLYEQVYPGRPPVIDGLLYAGTYLFVGAPKVGKSFLMAQLAYHVSMGLSLWGYEVRQGTVLYLALEDDHRRLQERLYRMFGVESTGNLFFAIGAKQLGGGLEEQLKGFVREHPDTRLIIIDTLQKVREEDGGKYSYANDYEVITKLKRFADGNGVCLLVVHHTRKQQADDKFDMISYDLRHQRLVGCGRRSLPAPKGAADRQRRHPGHFRAGSARPASLPQTGRGAACVGAGAAGNGAAAGAARPGVGGCCRPGNGGTARVERDGHGTCHCPGAGYETQCPGYAAECPGMAAVL